MADPQEPLGADDLVIVLIGASAVGKSTIAEYLCDTGVVEATPTWATRTPRKGERDTDYDHRFVTDAEFDRQSETGGFIDQHSFYGARYGVPYIDRPPEGKEALVVLKPVFMPVFMDTFPNARVYQIEASPVLLPDRMRERGQSNEDITERMKHHTSESSEARRYAHVVFTNNGPLEQTQREVASQIHADRATFSLSQASEA